MLATCMMAFPWRLLLMVRLPCMASTSWTVALRGCPASNQPSRSWVQDSSCWTLHLLARQTAWLASYQAAARRSASFAPAVRLPAGEGGPSRCVAQCLRELPQHVPMGNVSHQNAPSKAPQCATRSPAPGDKEAHNQPVQCKNG